MTMNDATPMDKPRPGTNVKRLIIERMSTVAVQGGDGSIGAVVAFLTSPVGLGPAAREATAWVATAIAAVKAAPDNPYGDDDEAIAGEILRQIEAKRVKTSGAGDVVNCG